MDLGYCIHQGKVLYGTVLTLALMKAAMTVSDVAIIFSVSDDISTPSTGAMLKPLSNCLSLVCCFLPNAPVRNYAYRLGQHCLSRDQREQQLCK